MIDFHFVCTAPCTDRRVPIDSEAMHIAYAFAVKRYCSKFKVYAKHFVLIDIVLESSRYSETCMSAVNWVSECFRITETELQPDLAIVSTLITSKTNNKVGE